jgi:hypothetical protein
MGDRMQKMDRRCSELRGLSRSAGLMVLCTLVPMFGWVLSVIIWMASLGAGFQAVFVKNRQAVRVPPVHATQAAGPSDPPEFTV